MLIRTLADAVSHYGRDAYLLSVSNDGPHTSNVTIELRDGSIDCGVSPTTSRNIAGVPNVSLFWPPTEPGGYALIVNGSAVSEQREAGAKAHITITKSVLHRPGPKPADSTSACASDCRPLTR